MDMTADPRHLNNQDLVSGLKIHVGSERKIIAVILTFIREVENRKLYLDYGQTSLFGFLTQEIGYAKGPAQRRIESARLLNEIPEIKKELESGALNLSQVSMMAQGIRQKEKEDPHSRLKPEDKKTLLDLIKNKDVDQSQKIIAQTLDINIKAVEKRTIQKDESVRVEMTLSKEQSELLNRVRELISHTHPNPSLAELVTYLAKAYVERKDPLIKRLKKRISKLANQESSNLPFSGSTEGVKPVDMITSVERVKLVDKTRTVESIKSVNKTSSVESVKPVYGNTSAVGVNLAERSKSIEEIILPKVGNRSSEAEPQKKSSLRKPIPADVKRQVFRRNQSCQWQDSKTGKICGSKFRLEMDHKFSVWAGGGNEIENLQLLCKIHNGLKYRREVGAWPFSS